MKITASRASLLSACQIAVGAVPTREVKPVLSNVKLLAGDDGSATLMATDLEVGVRLAVPDVAGDPGSLLLPAARFLSILREMTDDELSIEGDGKDVTLIRGNTAEYKLPADDPDTFPEVPAFDADIHAELSAGVLRSMIRRTTFATSAVADHRFSAMSSSVLWELEKKAATLVATDGKRMATVSRPCVGQLAKGIVPLKAVNLLDRNLADAEPDDLVHVSIRPNDVLMRTPRATICSRLTEGRFPNHRQALPKDHCVRVPLAVGPFYAAVRQAEIMTDDESIRVVFGFAKRKLTLTASGQRSGQSRVEMPVEYDAKPLEIALNPKYVTGMLKVLDPEASLTLDLIDGNAPVVFRDGDGWLCAVVPLVNN